MGRVPAWGLLVCVSKPSADSLGFKMHAHRLRPVSGITLRSPLFPPNPAQSASFTCQFGDCHSLGLGKSLQVRW